jgi:hypothetical protein
MKHVLLLLMAWLFQGVGIFEDCMSRTACLEISVQKSSRLCSLLCSIHDFHTLNSSIPIMLEIFEAA